MIVSGGTIWLGKRNGEVRCSKRTSVADEEANTGQITMNDVNARKLIQGHSGSTTPNSTVYLSYWYNGSASTQATSSESYNNRAKYIRAGNSNGGATYQGDSYAKGGVRPPTNPVTVSLSFSNAGTTSAYPNSTVFTWATGYSANIISYCVPGATCSSITPISQAGGPNGGSFSYAIAHVGAAAPTITSMSYKFTWNIKNNGAYDTTMIIPGKWNVTCRAWAYGCGYNYTGGGTYDYSFGIPANSIAVWTFDTVNYNSDARSANPVVACSGVQYISGSVWNNNDTNYWIFWNTNSYPAGARFTNVYTLGCAANYIPTAALGVFGGHGGLRILLQPSA